MSARGRHADSPKPPGERAAESYARSTWNSGGTPAGERILRELDSIQVRLGAMAEEEAGEATRLQRLAMLGEISGFVAHEFNNILTPLLAHAQVALRQPQDAERMALALERVVASVKRATAVAESILDLAKQDDRGVPRGTASGGGTGAGGLATTAGCGSTPVKMGKAAATVEDGRSVGTARVERAAGGASAAGATGATGADVGRCVRRAVEEVGGPAGSGGSGADYEVEAGLHAAIGEHDLQQVLLNLLLNARRANAARAAAMGRHGPDGHIIVRGKAAAEAPKRDECSYIDRCLPELLRMETEEQRGSVTSDNVSCVIEVEDNGGGVGAVAAAGLRARGLKVVERGSKQEAAGPGMEGGRGGGNESGGGRGCGIGGGGSGLGLEICRRVVERAGGRLEIESRAGSGTVVRVHLGLVSRLVGGLAGGAGGELAGGGGGSAGRAAAA